MGFFAPWFLAGLAAVGLPVYIHLLRQHKSNPRPFSSLMFFDRSTQSSIKHRRLRYLRLLALRLAVLILLALGFAGPYVMRSVTAFGDGDRLVIAVVDNSFSMREGNRLEQARNGALDVADQVAQGARGQVATLGARLNFLTQPSDDRGEFTAAIESIEASDARSSYGEFARALRAMAETARTPLDVHLFSDVQRSSMPSAFADLALPANVRLTVHPVSDDLTPNFAVENVIAPASLFDPSKATVQATIAGYGTEKTRHTVTLAANDKVLETKSVDVPANGRATVEFHSFEAPYGFNRAEIRIGSADKLPEDDRFLFAVERADPRQILFVQRRAGSRDLLYVRSALESMPNSAFRMQVVQTSQTRDLDPTRYSVVVLSDPGALPGSFEQSLKQFVRTGGAVLVAAGPATARLSRIPVMDLPVLESIYAARTGERFRAAGYTDHSHPAIGLEGLWDGVKFYQAVRVDAADTVVLSRLADETPLVVERQIGEGRTLLFTSTFDNISNDLPLYPAFVAFLERTTNYLGRIEDRTSARAVDAFIDLRAGEGQAQAIEVIDPRGNRALTLEESAQASTLQLDQVGFYELRRANDRNEMVAVNADRRESNLAVIPAETLALWQGAEEAVEAGAVTAEETRKPWDLWWYVLLFLLLAALAESLFATRYLRIDRGAA